MVGFARENLSSISAISRCRLGKGLAELPRFVTRFTTGSSGLAGSAQGFAEAFTHDVRSRPSFQAQGSKRFDQFSRCLKQLFGEGERVLRPEGRQCPSSIASTSAKKIPAWTRISSVLSIVPLISENPFRLARDIRSIGVRTADQIAARLGIGAVRFVDAHRARGADAVAVPRAGDAAPAG
jgi:hypothetical protein